jgi:hypothetical protein
MKVRKPFWIAVVAVAGAVWLPHVILNAVGRPMLVGTDEAQAGASYTATVSEDDGNTSSIHLTKPQGADKIVLKPSKKAGDGGVTIQLVAKDITCGGSPCTQQNHVLELWTHTLGMDIPGPTGAGTAFSASAGVVYNVSNGQALFPTGKNVTNGNKTFGTLVTSVFNHTLGIGLMKFRGPGSDPTSCGTVPLVAGNKCNDGPEYALTGFTVPADPTLKCTGDSGCSITQTCNTGSGLCETETCGVDGDCRSMHCDLSGGTGMCCSCPGSCPGSPNACP